MDKKQTSALSKLYQRQQPKVNGNKKVAGVLKSFAEDDYKRIAQLISLWLKQDESPKRQR